MRNWDNNGKLHPHHTSSNGYRYYSHEQFTNTYVKAEGFSVSKKKNKQKLNWIRLAEHGRIPAGCKYTNPRIKYDGINWYITAGIEYEDSFTIH